MVQELDIKKLDGKSLDIAEADKEKLKAVFPQCFVEGKLDIDKLLSLCGEYIDNDFEKYKFEWKGKSECLRIAGKRSTGTLRPCPEESVDFENTNNLYIEGDNLEVLKLLQTAYYRKVKMIYIDPPYNTGNDFVYEDDFKDPLAKYKEITSQTTKSNPETMGRYHTNWLNMMYPRLRLAANLLRDDGVIFISIDDNEVDNLKKICNEVFGEENFIAQVSNTNNPKGRSDDKFVATAHEYILIYAKAIFNLDWYGFEPTEEITKRYNKIDIDGRKYREIDLRKTGENDLREDRPNLFYYFYYNEKTKEFYPSREDIIPNGFIQIKPQRDDGKEGNWRWGLETATKQINELLPKFMPARKVWGVMEKDFLEGRNLVKPTSSWTFKDVNSERGSEEFIALGFDKRVFPKPKPIGTILRCTKLSTQNDDIVLDFFSGSATTAHAVMQLNAEDGGKRQFIMVQLPELTDEKSEAFRAGYKNICEIGKERIRRAGAKIKEQNADVDVGFKVLKLDTSNLVKWDDTPLESSETEVLKKRFDTMIKSLKIDRSELDVVYEVMLKLGIPATYQVFENNLNGRKVYSIGDDGLILVCLDGSNGGITPEDITAMCELAPAKIVAAEEAFKDDVALSNAFYISKDSGVEIMLL